MNLKWFLALAAAAALHAASIRGNVVENETGRSLARTQVVLQPLPGTPGGQRSARADRAGNFEFFGLAAGSYVVKAARRGYMPMEYGQKRWNSAGAPVVLAEDGNAVFTIRLARYSGIAGTVLDENDVGLPDAEVLAYRRTQPPELAGRGRSDERGTYRIYGLEPGSYLVRNAPLQDEDVTYLPTFSREVMRAEDARPVEVNYEGDATSVDVRPTPGRLYTLSGVALTNPPGLPVTVTLVSEMGRQTSQGSSFRFTSLAPVPYEVYAEALEIPTRGVRHQAAYVRNPSLDRELTMTLQPITDTQFDLVPPPPGGASSLQVVARRKDLAGPGPPEVLRMAYNRASLAPGRWDIMLIPPAGYYVSAFSGMPPNRGAGTRPDAWNEIAVEGFGIVRFGLSPSPGAVHGIVKSDGEAVAGAPVYLEAYDPAGGKRLADLRTVRTDTRGLYRFTDLAPGVYRILSTFEYRAPGAAEMELAGARSIRAEQNTDMPADLDLYVIR